ncbi:MAG: DUF2752 domain-containing protein [Clostridia bacterium]|nr:DUF2752 domain-containing protein [Clostridia bacterium]
MLILAVAVIAFYLTYGCPIRWLTGVSCPSCGMSRAVGALLKFDFALAFYFHPLVYLLPAAFLVYLLRKRIPRKVMIVLCVGILVLMLAVYIYRMSAGSDIVYAKFETGAVYRLFQYLYEECS